MVKGFWFNLPVKDNKSSKTFFKAIGLKSNLIYDKNEHLASFCIGHKKVVMMLFPRETFKTFACGFDDRNGHRWCTMYMDMMKTLKYN